MTALAQGAASTASAPLLSIRVSDGRRIVDPDDGTLTWTILDVSTEPKEESPVTVASGTVDLDDDRIGGATGHFAAVVTLSGSETKGAHEIRWAWEVDGVAFSWVQRFDVLGGVPFGLGGGYLAPSELRAEGVGRSEASDVQLLRAIKEQSSFFERVTGRWFEPRYLELKADGSDARVLFLGQPIIALESVVTVGGTEYDLTTAGAELVVYNRHIAGVVSPDDRDHPCVALPGVACWADGENVVLDEVYEGGSFNGSPQGLTLKGLFGYTEPDGSPFGETPYGVKRAVKMLVIRSLAKLACGPSTSEARLRNAVTSIRTRDQSITYADTAVKSAGPTGDRELDMLIATFARPMGVAVA